MIDYRERDVEEMVELLADLREWLDGQQDADYEPGVSGPHPNKAMQFCTRIDELIGEYS